METKYKRIWFWAAGAFLLGLFQSRRKEKLGIRIKFLLIFLLIGVVPIIFLGTILLQNNSKHLTREIKNKLLLLAEAKEGQVFAYLDSLESRTLDFSSDSFIRDSLKEINRTGSRQTVDELNRYLVKNKQVL
ncbi:MAG: hypothetical protein Q7K39_02530, partial [Candidatus Magasanikbacteria bacterium]|nr:hypothetical protein [Candidatus Magasanikbacteria bacterium]